MQRQSRLTMIKYKAQQAVEENLKAPLIQVKLGLTQAQLAEMVGIKQPSIARLENGGFNP